MTWQPIETAPKDGTRVLLFCPAQIGIVVGHWCNNSYHKKPRPYWTNDQENLWGVATTRGYQPTHWMPLPQPPAKEDGK